MRTVKIISDKGLVRLACVLGFIILIAHICFPYNLYRDCAGYYAYMTRAFAAGNFQEAFHPSIPPLNVFLAGMLTWIGFDPVRALILVSGLFYLATIPVLFLLLRRFAPAVVAGWGALLFACAPKIIRISGSGILDSAKIFFLTAAVYLIYRLFRSSSRKTTAILLGLSLGGLSLARSEGIANAALLFGCLLIGLWCHRKQFFWKGVMGCGGLTLLFWCLPLLPRVWYNHELCGRWVFDKRLADGVARLFFSASGQPSPVRAHSVSLLELLNQNFRGGYEFYMAAAVIGLLLSIFSRKRPAVWPEGKVPEFINWRNAFLLLLAVVAGNAAFHYAAALAAYRYFLLNIPLLMIFTLIACYWGWSWASRWIPSWVLKSFVVLILLLQIGDGVKNLVSPAGMQEYRTGLWLRERVAPMFSTSPRVWFYHQSPVWYWSGLERAVPIETPRPSVRDYTDFDLVIWGKDEDDLEVLSAREDLYEIELPPESPVRLFRLGRKP